MMGSKCRSEGPCAQSECNCGFYDKKESESEAALVLNGVVQTEKPKDTGDNFLMLMTEMAGVVGRFRGRIITEGKTFAKDFATLAPYMEGLSSTQEQIFLSAFAAAMDEANSHMQKVVGGDL